MKSASTFPGGEDSKSKLAFKDTPPQGNANTNYIA